MKSEKLYEIFEHLHTEGFITLNYEGSISKMVIEVENVFSEDMRK